MPTQAFDKTLVIEPAPKKPDSVDEPQATLTVLCGNDLGAVHVLSRAESVLGRGPTAQISLDDDGASRRHCQIVRAKDGYVVEDLGSTNGVYVDGVRIGPPVLLAPGARVQIGNTIMRFALLDALEREAARSMYEMSVHDGLTGVFNRRYLEELCHLGRQVGPVGELDRTTGIEHEHQLGCAVDERGLESLRAGDDAMGLLGSALHGLLPREGHDACPVPGGKTATLSIARGAAALGGWWAVPQPMVDSANELGNRPLRDRDVPAVWEVPGLARPWQ